MFVVMTIGDNLPDDIIWAGIDKAEADQKMLEVCSERISNWADYTPDDIQEVLNDGYERFGRRTIVMLDLSNVIQDSFSKVRGNLERAKSLGQEIIDSLKELKKVIERGEKLGLHYRMDEVSKNENP